MLKLVVWAQDFSACSSLFPDDVNLKSSLFGSACTCCVSALQMRVQSMHTSHFAYSP